MTRSKRVLIMTQALGYNYGGLMQAYALQKYVHSLGFDVVTNNHFQRVPMLRRALRMIKGRILRRTLSFVADARERETITTNTQRFIDKHIQTTDVYRGSKVTASATDKFGIFIVGSDQVWRKAYSNIHDHLLGFTTGRHVKRLSYAASFGLDNVNDYGNSLLKKSAELAKHFDAISVREESGVAICKEQWGVRATQVLDPTLLFDSQHYKTLIDTDSHYSADDQSSSGGVFYYLLDYTGAKRDITERVAAVLNKKQFGLVPKIPTTQTDFLNDTNNFTLPPVSKWLDGFNRADFVVTDSFHGVAFSIIFNKPFLVIGNRERGMARFSSILRLFKLEDRLISNASEVTNALIEQQIDWHAINNKIREERKKSGAFLKQALLSNSRVRDV